MVNASGGSGATFLAPWNNICVSQFVLDPICIFHWSFQINSLHCKSTYSAGTPNSTLSSLPHLACGVNGRTCRQQPWIWTDLFVLSDDSSPRSSDNEINKTILNTGLYNGIHIIPKMMSFIGPRMKRYVKWNSLFPPSPHMHLVGWFPYRLYGILFQRLVVMMTLGWKLDAVYICSALNCFSLVNSDWSALNATGWDFPPSEQILGLALNWPVKFSINFHKFWDQHFSHKFNSPPIMLRGDEEIPAVGSARTIPT